MFPTPSKEELVTILEELGIDSAIVAGGVVRDILLGAKESKDIDIFTSDIPFVIGDNFEQNLFEMKPKSPEGWAPFVLREPEIDEDKEPYEEELGAFQVYDTKRGDYDIQVVYTPDSPPIDRVCEHFDLSSSKCWLEIDGTIDTTNIWKRGLDLKEIWIVRKANDRSQQRAKRVLEKFPEHFDRIKQVV